LDSYGMEDVDFSSDGRWAVFALRGGSKIQLCALDPTLKMSDLEPQFEREFNPIIDNLASIEKVEEVVMVQAVEYTPRSDQDSKRDYSETIILLRAKLEQMNNTENRSDLAKNLNSLGWYELLTGDFVNAELHCRESLTFDPNSPYPNTNIPAALLFQGKYEAAKELYMEWKDKPFLPGSAEMPTFREAFLDDLNTFEKKGLVNDVNRVKVKEIREMLMK
jgi:tetratricopeptide (TPR) repeat protein